MTIQTTVTAETINKCNDASELLSLMETLATIHPDAASREDESFAETGYRLKFSSNYALRPIAKLYFQASETGYRLKNSDNSYKPLAQTGTASKF